MKNKTLLEIYSLTVCFFTLICFVIFLGMAIWNIVEISAPEFTLSQSRYYECYHSDEAYKNCFSNNYEYIREQNPLPFPTGEALTTRRTAVFVPVLKAEQREAAQDLVQAAIVLLISLILFILHWKISARIRNEYNQQ